MNPTYHPEARGLAFNVKCHSRVADDRGTPWQRDSAYEQAQRLWWEDAKRAAIKHGFTDVCQVGRSGGWLAPVIGDSCIDPDDADAETLARVEALGEELAEMLGEVDERFTEMLDAVIAEDEADAAEANYHTIREERRTETADTLIGAVREYVRAGHDLNIYREIEAALTAYDEARA